MNESTQGSAQAATTPVTAPKKGWTSTRDEDIARYQALPIEKRIRIAASMVIRTGRERTDR
jgi:hypothetical protein